MCTYLEGTKCSPPAPSTAPAFIKPTMGVVYGGWDSNLSLPTRGLYRDINQLSASDKIRCSGTELLFKTWMRSFLFFLSYSFRILVDHQFPHQRSEGESVALPMQNGETDHFFSTKRSRLLHSFDPSLGSVSSISTRNFVPRRDLFFFFFL